MESSIKKEGKVNLKEIKKLAKSTDNEDLLQDVKKRIANHKEVNKDGKD